MLLWLILLFIIVPAFDLWLLFQVGAVITFGPTFALVILTGIVGAALAKRQGLQTMARINAELTAGRMPTRELAEGLMILLAAAVLITPGFITDLFGLTLLVPPFRRLFLKALTRYFEAKIIIGGGNMHDFGEPANDPDETRSVSPPPYFGPNLNEGARPMKHVRNEAQDR
ncbi:MAG: FxsA family protein [Phycisphaerae bacterium]